MNKTFRKAAITVSALVAIVLVPISAATNSDGARGGFGEWPIKASTR